MTFRVAFLNLEQDHRRWLARRHLIVEQHAALNPDIFAAQIVCGDFNAAPDKPAAQLMATEFRPTQHAATAFTALADEAGEIAHPYWQRLDRSIDYIWLRGAITATASGLCFDTHDPEDETLWPSDHLGVWADLDWR